MATRLLLLFCLLANTTAAFAKKPVVVFLIGEHEYGTASTLPEFAKKELKGCEVRLVHAKGNDRKSPDCHQFPGLAKALESADVLFLSVRRRFPPKAEMALIKKWIADGKPVLGIRTSSHAFAPREKGTGYLVPEGHEGWADFDRDVFGADYEGHYGSKTKTLIKEVTKRHPIMDGVNLKGEVPVQTHLYKSENLDKAATVFLQGKVKDSDESTPVAWAIGKNRFYTSLGGETDMKLPWVRKMLVNAIFWSLGKSTDTDPNASRSKEADDKPLSPEQALKKLVTPDDLEVDLVAAEPVVEQPCFFNFDERGRMWVTQYRQYPHPAGIKAVSHDKYYRTIYDKVPAAPGQPGFVPGADKITIHEDTNGDGVFDKVKPFVEGLNMVTSFVRGRGGVFVLNPPYLLFYPDKDDDDVPDGDPVVHLSGFGLEDSHSYVMGLCWGPDGWLYGSQGSTVTSAIRVAGSDAEPVRRAGQLMWRYQPDERRYEVFAEGGGNIWSCEFDSQGRLFAGYNGGSPGFFYLQGAYYRKNFGKHGDLSNRHTYGFFEGIKHPNFKRVTTSICIYEGGALPGRYRGAILWANPILGRFGASWKKLKGLNFESNYIDLMIASDHRWFRPVYCDFGPDGAIYVCDWYDRQVSHLKNYEGQISKKDGRIFRIRAKGAKPMARFDYRKKSTADLVKLLEHPNRWHRETARRLIADRPDKATIVSKLKELLKDEGQPALEALWALHLCGKKVYPLEHENPSVRLWAVRLLGDNGKVTENQFKKLKALGNENHLEVRGQLASSATRLPVDQALELVSRLKPSEPEHDDPHIKDLCWWAIEKYCVEHPRAAMDEAIEAYSSTLVDSSAHNAWEDEFLVHLFRRLISENRRELFQVCKDILIDPGNEARRLGVLKAFEEVFRGRSLKELPIDFLVPLADLYDPRPVALDIRLHRDGAIKRGIQLLDSAKPEERVRIIEALSEFPNKALIAVPALLQCTSNQNERIRLAAYSALLAFSDPNIGAKVAEQIETLKGAEHDAARSLLTSRVPWCHAWLDKGNVPPFALEEMRRHGDTQLNARLDKIASKSNTPKPSAEAERILKIVKKDGGDPYVGHDLYRQRCATCHFLHNEGGAIGPDLTPYQRSEREDLVRAIVDPNAEIREGFETIVVKTKDGRTLSGFRVDEDKHILMLRPAGGEAIALKRDTITSTEAIGVSLMPPGLLAGLSDKALQDLFAYLRTTQPLNRKKKR